MTKYIKGVFQLSAAGVDGAVFAKERLDDMQSIVDWANENGVMTRIGTSDDNRCLCEYKIFCGTYGECRALFNDFKKEIKARFKKADRIWEVKGETMY